VLIARIQFVGVAHQGDDLGLVVTGSLIELGEGAGRDTMA